MDILRYIIETVVCSGLFLAIYRWMIVKKVSFRLCRLYIVSTMLLSAIIPAMEVPVYTADYTHYVFIPKTDIEEFAILKNEGEGQEVVPETTVSHEASDIQSVVRYAAVGIYALVTALSLALMLYSAYKIQRIRRKSRLTYTDEYTIAEHEDTKTPFSFLRTIFLGYNYENQEREQIIVHEASHVRHHHSYERIVLSLLRAFFWFNPSLWIAEKYLEEVQEWEADKDVLSRGFNIQTYRNTIFKQLFGYNPDISNGLNHSLTKQRFIMMTQSHFGRKSWLRLTAALPVIAIVFFAFGCGTKKAEAKEMPSAVSSVWSDKQSFADNKEIVIEIRKEERSDTYYAVIEGQRIDFDKVAETVMLLADGHPYIVRISAEHQTPMGAITDLKEALRTIDVRLTYTPDNEDSIPTAALETTRDEVYNVEVYEVNRNDVINIFTNANGKHLIGNEPGLFDAAAVEKVKSLIRNEKNDPRLPGSTKTDFILPDGSTFTAFVSNAIILLQYSTRTDYQDYTDIDTFVHTVYDELRDEQSSKVFGKPFASLSDQEADIIRKMVPINVAEATHRE